MIKYEILNSINGNSLSKCYPLPKGQRVNRHIFDVNIHPTDIRWGKYNTYVIDSYTVVYNTPRDPITYDLVVYDTIIWHGNIPKTMRAFRRFLKHNKLNLPSGTSISAITLYGCNNYWVGLRGKVK